jgi:benzodiazapine receptor
MDFKKLKLFIFSILICQFAGVIGSIFTINSIPTWYLAIKKPLFNPPNWIFGPVWTTLFFMMGIALYLILTRGTKTKKAKSAIGVFGIQLALNTLWSIIFFGLKAPLYALVELSVLWVFILLSIIRFYKISKPAAYLLIPYIVWVSFAAVLNLSIVLLN